MEQTLAGLRPMPEGMPRVGFRMSSKLTQGPAVNVADRHHPLRRTYAATPGSALRGPGRESPTRRRGWAGAGSA